MSNRREFITLLGGASTEWPSARSLLFTTDRDLIWQCRSIIQFNSTVSSYQEDDMQKTIWRTLGLAGFALILTASAVNAQDTVRVRGTIDRVEGPVYIVKSRDGSELKVLLADNGGVTAIVKASLSDRLVRRRRRDAAGRRKPKGDRSAHIPGSDARHRGRALSVGCSATEHDDQRQRRAECDGGRRADADA